MSSAQIVSASAIHGKTVGLPGLPPGFNPSSVRPGYPGASGNVSECYHGNRLGMFRYKEKGWSDIAVPITCGDAFGEFWELKFKLARLDFELSEALKKYNV